MATSDGLAERLANSGRFDALWSSTPLAILSVKGRPGFPPPAPLLSTEKLAWAQLRPRDAENLRIVFRTSEVTKATLALPWSPRWRVQVNRRAIAPGRMGDGLTTLLLPAGRGRVDLRYRPDAWDRLGPVITLLTLGFGAVWVLRSRRGTTRS